MFIKRYRRHDKIFVLKQCDCCKKEFEVTDNENKRANRRFCSKKCHDHFYSYKKTKARHKCRFCHNEFIVFEREKKRRVFCSRSCYESYRKAKRMDIIESIKWLQSEGLSNSEVAKRTGLGLNRVEYYIYQYNTHSVKGIKKKKALQNRWENSELTILKDFIKNGGKYSELYRLENQIDRSLQAIKNYFYKIQTPANKREKWTKRELLIMYEYINNNTKRASIETLKERINRSESAIKSKLMKLRKRSVVPMPSKKPNDFD
jgi:hypothetical protein